MVCQRKRKWQIGPKSLTWGRWGEITSFTKFRGISVRKYE